MILDPTKPISGLTDSKKLTEKKRNDLAEKIKDYALCWAIGRAEASEIDRINILQASLLAMQRAYTQLAYAPELVLVDGNQLPILNCPAKSVIRGDQLVIQISAASILAKVARDAEMQTLAKFFPHYGFAIHKAYPTALHLAKLAEFGACALHRKSFAPVKKLLGS